MIDAMAISVSRLIANRIDEISSRKSVRRRDVLPDEIDGLGSDGDSVVMAS